MAEPLHRYELGDEARTFIRHEIDFDPDVGLARWLRKLPIEEGTVTAWLRPGLVDRVLCDFDSGGSLSGEENVKLAEFVREYVGTEAAGTRLGIFWAWWASRDWTYLEHVARPFFTVEEGVYFFVNGSDDLEAIRKSMYRGRGYPSIGLLSRLSSEPELLDRSVQDERLLQDLAAGVDHLLIGAYDQEGWIVWTHPGRGPTPP